MSAVDSDDGTDSSSSLSSEETDDMEVESSLSDPVINSSNLGNNSKGKDSNLVSGKDNKSENLVSLESISEHVSVAETRVGQLMIKLTLLNAADPNSEEAAQVRGLFNQESKDLEAMLKVLKAMKERKESWVGAKDKVPNNIPKLQWVGCKFDSNSVVFSDANDALRKYRDVMIMHGLSPDNHWKRLLPAVLSQELSDRMEDIPDTVKTWKQFHVHFLNTVGVDNHEERQQAYMELLEISMTRAETLENYIDKFFQLKRRSKVKDSSIITDRFVKGLQEELKNKVSDTIDSWSSKKRSNFSKVLQFVKRVNKRVEKKTDNGVVKGSSNEKAKKEWQDFSKSNGANKQAGKEREGKSSFQERKERLQRLKQQGRCFTCEKDYVPGKHVCEGKDKQGKLSFKSMRRSKHKNNKIDNLLLESNLPLSKDNVSDIVPITLDGNRLYAFVDNAADFSSIHPRIFKLFNKSKFVKNNIGTVSLAYRKAKEVDRVGQFNNIDVLYNGISVKHDFELFDFNSDADVCIGRDLMPQINICMTGLATSWDLYEPVEEDPIDASVLEEDNTGNNYDAGTKEEREHMMREIQPLLDDNAKIPITSCCTLPGAEVELHIDESKYQFRRQYPIPHAYQQPVDDQVKTWLKDGVIAEADENDAKCYQSPLLAVRKKDLNGEYGKKIRVVLDIRSINEVLIPSSICKFQLPLISDLHQ
ncbi:hypothetical protein ABG067_007820, partial [Albugo candida]